MVSRQLDIEINSKYFSTRKTNTEKYENPSLQIKSELPSHCPLLKPDGGKAPETCKNQFTITNQRVIISGSSSFNVLNETLLPANYVADKRFQRVISIQNKL